ncbi:MAG: hypothetical protein AB8B48_07115 [Pseudomonadales bacterium]
MTKLIATSVVRGSNQGESHGGVFLINLSTDELLQPVDWNTIDIDWRGRGLDRGLRGIEFHKGKIYIAASDEIFVFDQSFNIIASHRNPYLKHCHEICIHQNHLFVTSTGYDCILGFNLETETFDWALKVVTDGMVFGVKRFNPSGDEGPLQINKLHINNVYCNNSGMYISGVNTRALLKFAGKAIGIMTTLPEGVHNARPFKDGVLFNDTRSDAVRFEAPSNRKAFRVPRFAPHKVTHTNLDDSRIARQGFGRGMCVISDTEIAAGSSPSTVSIYNLQEQKAVKVVNLSMDVRNAVHGLKVWPYEWPDRS